MEFAGKVLLGEAGPLAEGRNLQGHVPGFTRSFKSFGKSGIFELFFQIEIKVGLFHISNLSCQSRIRARAVSR
ncbi:MAG: hypothetical protein ACRD4E_17170, partial [Bryobacteraceae bacterium]